MTGGRQMSNDLVSSDSGMLLDARFLEQAMKLAEYMATAKTLPDHLRGSPGDCLRVIEIAHRTRQSPYAIGDKTYFVSGKLAFEGQLCAALINAHSSIEQRLDYRYEGEGPRMACVVSARLRGEAQTRTIRVTLEQGKRDSKGARQRWEHDPEQMLAYYGSRVWARRHAPEILLGLYTVDELEAGQMREINPGPSHDPQTGEIHDDPMDQIARPAATPEAPASASEDAAAQPDPVQMVQIWISEADQRETPLDGAVDALTKVFRSSKSPAQLQERVSRNFAVISELSQDEQDELDRLSKDVLEKLKQPEMAV